ncbi:nucleoside ABC transporter membrane protein [Palleronia marisminoris]|uniref:D-allose transport system permease protein AlsC n=1 Tax=Palleronia marisminoris TaxID=315423 RepID=A0A1Y5RW99_9RHOB|nr:ABC transporter permease [Palleronia marisminoris]SFG46899.1 nucleoside ABC transporter membrane protein [Palleronia marisminoris]SLN25587.1 D-allose transport system permease protein AlsC [Palleronia marisminoris]
MQKLPKWADVGLIPAINLALALIVSGLVVSLIGQDPFEALAIMVRGAVGSTYGWGYTLYYATNFVFTGLAVAIAFHAKLFNIGGEGQAQLGSLGVALVCLAVPWPHWTLALPSAIVGGALFGAAWAAIPGYLQAKRGSHIVITTIMFNFIASALLVYLLVGALKAPGMAPETVRFPEGARLPSAQEILAVVGIPFSRTPLNISFLVALIACWGVWLLLWRMRLGYEIRAFGHSEPAARYAGISPLRITMLTMLISGALAGLMGINAVMGEQERLLQDNVLGAGFVGIAVALMGRSHPVGVLLAAILFGALYQGGAELEFETSVPREMVVVIQALVILFTGALDGMVRGPLEKSFLRFRNKPKPGVPAE